MSGFDPMAYCEALKPVPGWWVLVSKSGAVLSSLSGKPRSCLLRKDGTVQWSLVGPGGKRRTATMVWLLQASGWLSKGEYDAAVRKRCRLGEPWTPAEDARLKSCKTFLEAVDLLPHRSASAIGTRRSRIGHSFGRAPTSAPPITRPFSNALYRKAFDAVPRWLESHEREDLISDVIVLILEGACDDVSAAYKIARAARNRLMHPARERSLDAPLFSDSNVSLLDRLDTEGRIW